MRVAFLCDEYPPFRNGGIGTYTKEVAERLVKMGHDVSVIGVFADVVSDEEAAENGVRLLRLAPSRLGLLGNRINVYRQVKALEQNYGLDILETQEYGGFLMGWPKTHFKIIVRLHGSILYFNQEFNDNSWKNIPWRIAEGSTLRRADQIVSVSQYTADRTKKIFSLKMPIKVIYNGVSLPERKALPMAENGTFRVIFGGSMQAKKGFLKLLSAWKGVLDHLPNAELHLAGKDNSNQLDKIAEILQQTESVTYHGVLAKSVLEDLYRTMDLAVFPSFVEAFSLAPMEAMAVGIPVIYTTRCSGPELIEDGITGLLVDPKNSSDITDAILRVAAMTVEERVSLGRRGQMHIQDGFSIERLARDNEQMMKKLIGACNRKQHQR